MEIKIIFDNYNLNSGFIPGWGFSCLVDGTILFDTGENAEYLFSNMKNLNVDIPNIEAVVISHDHWDHTGGLYDLLKKRKGLKVYGCPNFSKKFKEEVKTLKGNLILADKLTMIKDDIFITGEIEGEYNGVFLPEQGLFIKRENGITVISGCAHPGIIKIIKNIKENFPKNKIKFVFGGFHLMDKDTREIGLTVEKFKELGVEKVGPTHCSGSEAQTIFRKSYKDKYIQIAAGKTLNI